MATGDMLSERHALHWYSFLTPAIQLGANTIRIVCGKKNIEREGVM